MKSDIRAKRLSQPQWYREKKGEKYITKNFIKKEREKPKTF
jgi:hypothetical protein